MRLDQQRNFDMTQRLKVQYTVEETQGYKKLGKLSGKNGETLPSMLAFLCQPGVWQHWGLKNHVS